MAQTDNIATDVVMEMRDELADMRADRTPAQPFMTEKKSPAAALKAMERMTPGERKEMREKMGDDAMREIVLGRGA
jgi:hypothetical protein